MGRAKGMKPHVAALAIGLLVMQSPIAYAQATYDRGANQSVAERAHPEYDPLGLRWGGFDVHPALDVSAVSNDNVFADETNERSDVAYIAQPRIRADSHWSRHHLGVEVGGQIERHQDFKSEDIGTSYANLDIGLDVRRATQIGVRLGVADLAEARTDPDSPAAAIEPIHYQTNSVTGYLQQQFNRVRLSVIGGRTQFDFEDGRDGLGNVIEQDDRDRDESYVTLRGEIAMTPRIALLVQGSFDKTDYDLVFPSVPWNRNSNGQTYLVGANFDLTRLARGQVAIGYYNRDWKDAALGNDGGLAVDVNVDWFPTQLTTVTLTGVRRVEDSGEAFAASFLHSQAGVRVDHELLRNVILSAGLRGERREYRGIERDDDVVYGDLGLRYALGRRVVLGGGYQYEHQDSDGANRDRSFITNRFVLSIGLRI